MMTRYHSIWMVALCCQCNRIKYMGMCCQIFINNEFVNSISGKVFPTVNPATGEKIIDVQEGDKVRYLLSFH